MRKTFNRHVGNERGAALVFVALLLLTLFMLMAIAIDVGMLLNARSEAQRAADSAALAGAAEYLNRTPSATVAEANARQYAGLNVMAHAFIQGDDEDEVVVEVLHAEQKVRVWVGKPVSTFFARLLGINDLPVRAMAAAQVLSAGSAKCVMPFAIPDTWTREDGSGDIADYKRFELDNPDDPTATGYGSLFRNPDGQYDRDYGREMTFREAPPGQSGEGVTNPGNFLPWVLPGSDRGNRAYENNIKNCNQTPIVLGDEYEVEPGLMANPTRRAIREVWERDSGARWNPNLNDGLGGVENSEWGEDWMNSPRVVKLALYDPRQTFHGRSDNIVFNNFALFFLGDPPQAATDPVVGHYLDPAIGIGAGDGSLAKVLQLVE